MVLIAIFFLQIIFHIVSPEETCDFSTFETCISSNPVALTVEKLVNGISLSHIREFAPYDTMDRIKGVLKFMIHELQLYFTSPNDVKTTDATCWSIAIPSNSTILVSCSCDSYISTFESDVKHSMDYFQRCEETGTEYVGWYTNINTTVIYAFSADRYGDVNWVVPRDYEYPVDQWVLTSSWDSGWLSFGCYYPGNFSDYSGMTYSKWAVMFFDKRFEELYVSGEFSSFSCEDEEDEDDEDDEDDDEDNGDDEEEDITDFESGSMTGSVLNWVNLLFFGLG